MTSQMPSPGFDTLYLVARGAHGSAGDGIFVLSGDASAGNIVSLTLAPGVNFPQRSKQWGSGQGFCLSLYHLNDLHGHLARFIASAGMRQAQPGNSQPSFQAEEAVISRIAWQIRNQRKALANSRNHALLFFSAGDDCTGSIFDELLGATPADFQMHAAYRLYSALGMDAACLGNHEFDLGLDLLRESIQRDARFPLLAANLTCPPLENFCYPAAIFVVKGIRVGVIGLVTQAELKIGDSPCRVIDPIPAARNLVALMRPYCDALIILSHLGYCLANAPIPMLNAGDVELANSLPPGSIHLIIGGHTHHSLNPQGLNPQNVVNGIPIVQAGSAGQFLGRVDLKISAKDTAVLRAQLIPVHSLPVDEEFDREFARPVITKARALFDEPLGAALDDPEMGEDILTVRYAAGELPLENFVADAMIAQLEKAGQPVHLAMIDSSSLQRGLPPGGHITFGDWFNIMPYADKICIYRLSGAELNELLQDNAKRIDRLGEPCAERGFLRFSKQLRYAVLMGKNRADALAAEITVNGSPLESLAGSQFLVASTDFVREYASAWEKSTPQHQPGQAPDLKHHPRHDSGLFLRRALVDFIRQTGGVTPEAGAVCDGRLRILEDGE